MRATQARYNQLALSPVGSPGDLYDGGKTGLRTQESEECVGYLPSGHPYYKRSVGFTEHDESIAWLGDCELLANARTYILNSEHKRNDVYCKKFVSNKTMREFLELKHPELIIKMKLSDESEHTFGTCFEILWVINPWIQLEYFQYVSGNNLTLAEMKICNWQTTQTHIMPKCWHKLFIQPPLDDKYPFTKEDFITKQQARTLAKEWGVITTKTIAIEQVTSGMWVVTSGNKDFEEAMEGLPTKARISGEDSHDPKAGPVNAIWNDELMCHYYSPLPFNKHERAESIENKQSMSFCRDASGTLVRRSRHYSEASEERKKGLLQSYKSIKRNRKLDARIPNCSEIFKPPTDTMTPVEPDKPKPVGKKQMLVGGKGGCWRWLPLLTNDSNWYETAGVALGDNYEGLYYPQELSGNPIPIKEVIRQMEITTSDEFMKYPAMKLLWNKVNLKMAQTPEGNLHIEKCRELFPGEAYRPGEPQPNVSVYKALAYFKSLSKQFDAKQAKADAQIAPAPVGKPKTQAVHSETCRCDQCLVGITTMQPGSELIDMTTHLQNCVVMIKEIREMEKRGVFNEPVPQPTKPEPIVAVTPQPPTVDEALYVSAVNGLHTILPMMTKSPHAMNIKEVIPELELMTRADVATPTALLAYNTVDLMLGKGPNNLLCVQKCRLLKEGETYRPNEAKPNVSTIKLIGFLKSFDKQHDKKRAEAAIAAVAASPNANPVVGTKELVEFVKKETANEGAIQLGTKEWDIAIKSDLAKVRNIMSRTAAEVTKVNPGSDKKDLSALEDALPQYHLVEKKGIANPHAMIAVTRKLVYSTFLKLHKHRPVVDVGGDPTKAGPDTHTMRPDLDVHDGVRNLIKPNNSGCSHTLSSCDCKFKPGSGLIFVDSIYDIQPIDVVAFCNKHKMETFYFAISTEKVTTSKLLQKLPFESGSSVQDGINTATFLVGESNPYVNQSALTQFWSEVDLIHDGKVGFRVHTVSKVGMHTIRSAHLLINDASVYKEIKLIKTVETRLKVMVPTLKYNTIVGWKGASYTIVRQPLDLNINFFNQLCDRNINGRIGLDTLTEYGLAIAHSKYSMHDKTITNYDITARDIRLTAYLAHVYMTRVNYGLSEYADASYTLGSGQQVAWSAIMMGAQMVNDWVPKLLTKIGGTKFMQIADKFLSNGAFKIDEDAFKGIWTQLDSVKHISKTHQLKVMPQFEEVTGSFICPHHSGFCMHEGEQKCQCCGGPSEGDFCDCCISSSHKHACGHVCVTGHGEGSTKCDCCKTFGDNNPCINCNESKSNFINDLTDMLLPSPTKPTRKTAYVPEHTSVGIKDYYGNQVYDKHPINTMDLGNKWHRHECLKCHGVYEHQHSFKSLQHYQHVNECPHCNPTSSAIKKNYQKVVSVDLQQGSDLGGHAHKCDCGELFHCTAEANHLTTCPSCQAKSKMNYKSALQSDTRDKSQLAPTAPTPGATKSVSPTLYETEHVHNCRNCGSTYIHTHPYEQVTHEHERCQNCDVDPQTNTEGASLSIKLLEMFGVQYMKVLTQGWADYWDEVTEINAPYGPGETKLLFPCAGMNTYPGGSFKVRQMINITNDDKLCGYYAISTVLKDVTLPDLIATTGTDGGWSMIELLAYAEKRGDSLLIISDEICMAYVQETGTDIVPSIVHVLNDDYPNGHWQPCSAVQVGPSTTWPAFEKTFSMRGLAESNNTTINAMPSFDALSLEERIQYLKPVISTLEQAREMSKTGIDEWRLVQSNSLWIISNNKMRKHTPHLGQLAWEVPPQYLSMYQSALSSLKTKLPTSLEIVSVNAMGVQDLATCLDAEIRLNLAAFNSVVGPSSHSSPGLWLKVKQEPKMNITFIKLLNTKLKPGDVILIKDSQYKFYRTIINVQPTHVVVAKLPITKETLLVLVPKISIFSVAIRLVAAHTCPWTPQELNELLKSTEAYDGVPGSGKSSLIKSKFDQNSLACAMTSGAIQSIKNKKINNVVSVERLMWSKPTPSTLFVDEASSLTLASLAMMTPKSVKKLHLLGDTDQVVYVDMFATAGTRKQVLVMSLAGTKHNLDVSYRIGPPLSLELAKVQPRFKGAQHETKVTLLNFADVDIDNIKTLIDDYNVDAIWVFYDALQKMLTTAKIEHVYKVHADQGREADTVLVIQGSISQGSVHFDRNYCYSAASRAKKHLVWLSVNCYEDTSSLASRISGYNSLTRGRGPLKDRLIEATDLLQSKDISIDVGPEVNKLYTDKMPAHVLVWAEHFIGAVKVSMLQNNTGGALGYATTNGKVLGVHFPELEVGFEIYPGSKYCRVVGPKANKYSDVSYNIDSILRDSPFTLAGLIMAFNGMEDKPLATIADIIEDAVAEHLKDLLKYDWIVQRRNLGIRVLDGQLSDMFSISVSEMGIELFATDKQIEELQLGFLGAIVQRDLEITKIEKLDTSSNSMLPADGGKSITDKIKNKYGVDVVINENIMLNYTRYELKATKTIMFVTVEAAYAVFDFSHQTNRIKLLEFRISNILKPFIPSVPKIEELNVWLSEYKVAMLTEDFIQSIIFNTNHPGSMITSVATQGSKDEEHEGTAYFTAESVDSTTASGLPTRGDPREGGGGGAQDETGSNTASGAELADSNSEFNQIRILEERIKMQTTINYDEDWNDDTRLWIQNQQPNGTFAFIPSHTSLLHPCTFAPIVVNSHYKLQNEEITTEWTKSADTYNCEVTNSDMKTYFIVDCNDVRRVTIIQDINDMKSPIELVAELTYLAGELLDGESLETWPTNIVDSAENIHLAVTKRTVRFTEPVFHQIEEATTEQQQKFAAFTMFAAWALQKAMAAIRLTNAFDSHTRYTYTVSGEIKEPAHVIWTDWPRAKRDLDNIRALHQRKLNKSHRNVLLKDNSSCGCAKEFGVEMGVEEHSHIKIYLSQYSVNCVRSISALYWPLANTPLAVMFNYRGRTIGVSATTGCSACTGITFYDLQYREVAKVSAQYANWAYRRVSFKNEIGAELLELIGIKTANCHIDRNNPFLNYWNTLPTFHSKFEEEDRNPKHVFSNTGFPLYSPTRAWCTLSERVATFAYAILFNPTGLHALSDSKKFPVVMKIFDENTKLWDSRVAEAAGLFGISFKRDMKAYRPRMFDILVAENLSSKGLLYAVDQQLFTDLKGINGAPYDSTENGWTLKTLSPEAIIGMAQTKLIEWLESGLVGKVGRLLESNGINVSDTEKYITYLNDMQNTVGPDMTQSGRVQFDAGDAFDNAGAIGPITGSLTIPWEMHKEHKTAVWTHFLKKAAKIELAGHDLSSLPLYLPIGHVKILKSVDPYQANLLDLQEQNTSLLSRSTEVTVNTLGAVWVKQNVGNALVTSHTNIPQCTILNSYFEWVHVKPRNVLDGDEWENEIQQIKPVLREIADMMSHKEASESSKARAEWFHANSEGVGTWYTRTAVRSTIQYFGTTGLCIGVSDFLAAHQPNTVSYLLCPSKHVSHELGTWLDADKPHFAYSLGDRARLINKSWIDWIRRGDPKTDGSTIHYIRVKGALLGHHILEVFSTTTRYDGPYYHMDLWDTDEENTVTYTMPELNFAMHDLSKHGLFNKAIVTMPSKIHRLLELRMCRPATSFDDLLQYLRTLRYTTYFSSTSKHSKVDGWTQTSLKWAMCVYLDSSVLAQQVKGMSEMNYKTGLSGNTLINMLVDRSADFIKGMLADLTKHLNLNLSFEEFVDQISEAVGSDSRAGKVLAAINTMVKNTSVQKNVFKPMVYKYFGPNDIKLPYIYVTNPKKTMMEHAKALVPTAKPETVDAWSQDLLVQKVPTSAKIRRCLIVVTGTTGDCLVLGKVTPSNCDEELTITADDIPELAFDWGMQATLAKIPSGKAKAYINQVNRTARLSKVTLLTKLLRESSAVICGAHDGSVRYLAQQAGHNPTLVSGIPWDEESLKAYDLAGIPASLYKWVPVSMDEVVVRSFIAVEDQATFKYIDPIVHVHMPKPTQRLLGLEAPPFAASSVNGEIITTNVWVYTGPIKLGADTRDRIALFCRKNQLTVVFQEDAEKRINVIASKIDLAMVHGGANTINDLCLAKTKFVLIPIIMDQLLIGKKHPELCLPRLESDGYMKYLEQFDDTIFEDATPLSSELIGVEVKMDEAERNIIDQLNMVFEEGAEHYEQYTNFQPVTSFMTRHPYDLATQSAIITGELHNHLRTLTTNLPVSANSYLITYGDSELTAEETSKFQTVVSFVDEHMFATSHSNVAVVGPLHGYAKIVATWFYTYIKAARKSLRSSTESADVYDGLVNYVDFVMPSESWIMGSDRARKNMVSLEIDSPVTPQTMLRYIKRFGINNAVQLLLLNPGRIVVPKCVPTKPVKHRWPNVARLTITEEDDEPTLIKTHELITQASVDKHSHTDSFDDENGPDEDGNDDHPISESDDSSDGPDGAGFETASEDGTEDGDHSNSEGAVSTRTEDTNGAGPQQTGDVAPQEPTVKESSIDNDELNKDVVPPAMMDAPGKPVEPPSNDWDEGGYPPASPSRQQSQLGEPTTESDDDKKINVTIKAISGTFIIEERLENNQHDCVRQSLLNNIGWLQFDRPLEDTKLSVVLEEAISLRFNFAVMQIPDMLTFRVEGQIHLQGMLYVIDEDVETAWLGILKLNERAHMVPLYQIDHEATHTSAIKRQLFPVFQPIECEKLQMEGYYTPGINDGLCENHIHYLPLQELDSHLGRASLNPNVRTIFSRPANYTVATTELKNWLEVVKTMKEPVIMREMQIVDLGVYSPNTSHNFKVSQVKHWRLYFIITENGLIPAISIPQNLGTFFYTGHNEYASVSNCLLDGRANLNVQPQRVTKVVGQEASTRYWDYGAAKALGATGKIITGPGPCNVMYIHDYDNLNHHGRQDVEEFKKLKFQDVYFTTKWVNERIFKLIQDRQTEPRLSIKNRTVLVTIRVIATRVAVLERFFSQFEQSVKKVRHDEQYRDFTLVMRNERSLDFVFRHLQHVKWEYGVLKLNFNLGSMVQDHEAWERCSSEYMSTLPHHPRYIVTHANPNHDHCLINLISLRPPIKGEGQAATPGPDDQIYWFKEGDKPKYDRMMPVYKKLIKTYGPDYIVYLCSGGGKSTMSRMSDIVYDCDKSVRVPAIPDANAVSLGFWADRNAVVQKQLLADGLKMVGKVLLVWHPACVPPEWRGLPQLLVTIDDIQGERLFEIGNQSLKDYANEHPTMPRIHCTRNRTFDLMIKHFNIYSKNAAVTAMMNMTMEEVNPYKVTETTDKINTKYFIPYIPADRVQSCTTEGYSSIEDEPNTDVINMFTNRDLSDWLVRSAPTSNLVIKSSEQPGEIKTIEKTTLTRYPVMSRPVLTKAVFQTYNAVSTRLGSVTSYRKYNLNPQQEFAKIARAYFHDNWQHVCNKFSQNAITYNAEAVTQWLKEHPGTDKIQKEVDEILAEGFLTNPLNKLNVHNKLESLLKTDPITQIQDQKVRIIVWQRKGYAAIFSPIFIEAKKRLKTLLREGVIYADGYTPQELSARLRTTSGCTRFFESDMAKQDRQTDHDTLDVEFEVYKCLGVHENLLSVWRSVHRNWRFKNNHMSGNLDAMRMTGQATTAIGNVIVNMAVHADMVIKNRDNIQLILLLGDDNLMLTSAFLDLSKFKTDTKERYNMEVKPESHPEYGTFIQLIAYHTPEGTCELAPDWIRLTRRFEVTNGVSEATDENLEARCMSYSMMLGNLPEVTALVAAKQWPIVTESWYNASTAAQAMAIKHDMSIHQVNAMLAHLITMMASPKLHTQSWDVWVPVK
nr:polyprotein [Alphaendornavirus sp.]